MYSYPSNYNKNFNPSGLPYSVMLAETLNFQARMTAAGGNLLSPVELNAINYWISQYKYYNLWDKMVAAYPLVGGRGTTGSKDSFKINLISSLYGITYGAGVTEAMCNPTGFKNTGAISNGSNTWLDSGISQGTLIDLNPAKSLGMSCYVRTHEAKLSTSQGGTDMGCIINSTYAVVLDLSALFVWLTASGNVMGGTLGSYAAPADLANNAPNRMITGFYSMSYIDNQSTLFKDGSLIMSTRHKPNIGSITVKNIYLGSSILAATNFPANFSNRGYGGFYIHKAYTAAEEKQRVIIEQNFQNMLGRAITLGGYETPVLR
jgi:hypothetical protein